MDLDENDVSLCAFKVCALSRRQSHALVRRGRSASPKGLDPIVWSIIEMKVHGNYGCIIKHNVAPTLSPSHPVIVLDARDATPDLALAYDLYYSRDDSLPVSYTLLAELLDIPPLPG